MKTKLTTILAALLAASLGLAACGDDDDKGKDTGMTEQDTGEQMDTGEEGDTSDEGDTGAEDTGEEGDTSEEGDTTEGGDTGEQMDTGDQMDSGDQMDGGDTMASLTVSDEISLTSPGEVTIDSATVPEQAWVVIHEDDNGSFGDVIGHAQLSAGENTDVTVTLDRDAEDMETLWAMLHEDTGEQGTYEFGDGSGEDAPWTDENGDPIMESFTVLISS